MRSSPTRCRGRRTGTTCGSAAASRATPPAATAPSPAARSCSAQFTFEHGQHGAARSAGAVRRAALSAELQPRHHGTYVLNQWLYAGFVQDSFRVGNDLTLDLGLRYDRQTLHRREERFAPRVGFGWHPGGDPKTAVRGGYGMYYTQLRANTDRELRARRPRRLFTYTATPGPDRLSDLPHRARRSTSTRTPPPARCRRATSRSGRAWRRSTRSSSTCRSFPATRAPTFVNPRSQVASIGFERELAPRLFVVGRLRQAALDRPRSHASI